MSFLVVHSDETPSFMVIERVQRLHALHAAVHGHPSLFRVKKKGIR